MDIAAKRDRPRTVTSRKNIKYRKSGWRVQEFELWSGEMVCRAAALHMQDSLLVWLGEQAAARLTSLALGMPALEGREGGCAALLGDGGEEASAAQLARRLAAGLARPVYVCCGAGASWDRHTMPRVERALLAEMRRRQPDLS